MTDHTIQEPPLTFCAHVFPPSPPILLACCKKWQSKIGQPPFNTTESAEAAIMNYF